MSDNQYLLWGCVGDARLPARRFFHKVCYITTETANVFPQLRFIAEQTARSMQWVYGSPERNSTFAGYVTGQGYTAIPDRGRPSLQRHSFGPIGSGDNGSTFGPAEYAVDVRLHTADPSVTGRFFFGPIPFGVMPVQAWGLPHGMTARTADVIRRGWEPNQFPTGTDGITVPVCVPAVYSRALGVALPITSVTILPNIVRRRSRRAERSKIKAPIWRWYFGTPG